jgi:hypothetical protein
LLYELLEEARMRLSASELAAMQRHVARKSNVRRAKADTLTLAQALDAATRASSVPTMTSMRDQPAERAQRDSKYGNTKVVDGGRTFDSKAEHKRWQYLSLLERAGEIRELQLQVPFELIPAQARPSGGKERPTVYLADFVYVDRAGKRIVEDVKGAVTPEFRLKRKLMLWRHGVEVQEVRS